MAISPGPLFEPLQLLSGAAIYYVASANTRIDKLTVANQDINPRQVQIYWVPSGGSLSTPGAIIIPTFDLQPAESRDLWQFIGHILGVGDGIGASCDDSGVVNFFGSGTQITPT